MKLKTRSFEFEYDGRDELEMLDLFYDLAFKVKTWNPLAKVVYLGTLVLIWRAAKNRTLGRYQIVIRSKNFWRVSAAIRLIEKE